MCSHNRQVCTKTDGTLGSGGSYDYCNLFKADSCLAVVALGRWKLELLRIRNPTRSQYHCIAHGRSSSARLLSVLHLKSTHFSFPPQPTIPAPITMLQSQKRDREVSESLTPKPQSAKGKELASLDGAPHQQARSTTLTPSRSAKGGKATSKNDTVPLLPAQQGSHDKSEERKMLPGLRGNNICDTKGCQVAVTDIHTLVLLISDTTTFRGGVSLRNTCLYCRITAHIIEQFRDHALEVQKQDPILFQKYILRDDKWYSFFETQMINLVDLSKQASKEALGIKMLEIWAKIHAECSEKRRTWAERGNLPLGRNYERPHELFDRRMIIFNKVLCKCWPRFSTDGQPYWSFLFTVYMVFWLGEDMAKTPLTPAR